MNSLEKTLVIAILSVFAILILAATIAYRSMAESVETARLVRRTYDVMTELKATLATLRAAESGARGYVITGDDLYLEPYRKAPARVDRRIERLKRLTADHASQQHRLATIADLASAKLGFVSRVIDARAGEGFAAAERLMATNAGNRREMNHRPRAEVARWRRYRHSLSLILLNIDHFKMINDTYGHGSGDEVLQWAAGRLRSAVRNTDMAAHIGGEEFDVTNHCRRQGAVRGQTRRPKLYRIVCA